MSQTAIGIGAEHLTRLLGQLPAIVWSTDTDLRVTSRYGGVLKVFGHEQGPVDGTPVAEFADPQDQEAVVAAHRSALAGHSSSYEARFQGRTFRARVDPLIDANGDTVGVVGFAIDVTEAKRSEEQLRASRAALRSLATRQQDIREDERTRIAREIHDSLGQALTALKLRLSAAQEAASEDVPALGNRLHETVQMVDDLVKSVRRIASDMRPPILDQLGLPAAVEWLAQDFARRTGIRCDATILPTSGAITDELATAIFRIVQEALTNVLRHAGGTRVDIELGVKSGCVTLEIDDDGSGITEAGTIGPGSLGILGMRERAAALGGVLEVAPRPNGGTRVAAWFPRAWAEAGR
jgi:hypothetical protein